MEQVRNRLREYPPRFRARVAGRVVQVTLPVAGASPRYEAVIEVEKAHPLPPASFHQLTGFPIIEVLDDEVDNIDVSSEDEDEVEENVDSPEVNSEENDESSSSFPQYRVHTRKPKTPPPLYPLHPPLNRGDRVRLIWQGQKDVPGIVAGTFIRCSGLLSREPGQARIFNPRYEIVPLRLLRARIQK